MSAEGRYCIQPPGRCYCGKCDHYVPIRRDPRTLDPRVWGKSKPPAKEAT